MYRKVLALCLMGMVAGVTLLGAIGRGPAVAQPLITGDDGRVSLLARAYNTTGQLLFKHISTNAGNIVLSPYSIGTAMSMALIGARGDTASEMMRALSMNLPSDAVKTENAEVLASLNAYDRSAALPLCPPGATVNGRGCEMSPTGDMPNQCRFELTLQGDRCTGPAQFPASAKLLAANALMLRAGGASNDYIATLKKQFAAEVFQDATLDTINSWVAGKTDGKVPRMLERDPGGAAVLLNTLYFKARWAKAFEEGLTKNESFSLTRSKRTNVPLMKQTGYFPVVSRVGYRALRVDYEFPEFGLVIVLPDKVEGAAQLARQFDGNELAKLFAALRDGQAIKLVALALPRFKAESDVDLVAPFQRAGIHKAFEPAAADFSGMTGRPGREEGLYLTGIKHRATIDVAEESTVAAAATAVSESPSAIGPTPAIPEVFRVDRPFLFYVVNDTTGMILFEGRIADPRR